MKRLLRLLPLLVLLALPVGFAAQRLLGPRLAPIDVTESTASPLAGQALAAAPRTAVVHGRVVSVDGDPVEDALVLEAGPAEPRWASTDAAGRFTIVCAGSLPPTLTVVAREFEPRDFPLDPERDLTAEVELLLGSRVPPTPVLPPIERRTLRGRIVPAVEPERDLAGYEVLVEPRQLGETLDGAVPRRTGTDAGGAFRFEDLAAGDYRLSVLPPWAAAGTWPDLVAPDARALRHRADVSPAEAREVRVVELAEGAIRGRVSDAQGAFVAGALVTLASSENPGRVWPPVTTGADGSFLLRDLPEGGYVVSVRAGAAAAETPIQVRPGTIGTLDLELTSPDR